MSAETVRQKCRKGGSTTHVLTIPSKGGSPESFSLPDARWKDFRPHPRPKRTSTSLSGLGYNDCLVPDGLQRVYKPFFLILLFLFLSLSCAALAKVACHASPYQATKWQFLELASPTGATPLFVEMARHERALEEDLEPSVRWSWRLQRRPATTMVARPARPGSCTHDPPSRWRLQKALDSLAPLLFFFFFFFSGAGK